MNTSYKIPCVILCGGKSSRMGEDKALLPFSSSTTLTQYQFDRLNQEFDNVYISSKTNKFDFIDENNLILDKGEVFSPIIALQTILENIESKKIFIITVDTPLVKIDTIKTLMNKSEAFDICVAQTKKTHNLCGVFSKDILSTINEMLEQDIHKVGYLLKNSNTNIVDFLDDDEFINVNNKEEYSKAKSLL